ncbi:hypothetical protein Pla52o_14080 [Novipirellula galeiformis]|uniref:Acetyltransferase n=1 Tax=Novipirellula galeiformis TaxID=2528004 RepID=A0A5C6CKI6_9BACT|nr:acetyltransferase [Novipirellula galeiformis]TWU25110.1 hypothetical protein Pla52o_14080 [Novipirellula galeiformis]
MFMKDKRSGNLIRVDELSKLASPHETSVAGHRQAGEEEQDREAFDKSDLTFPSGEALPRCWVDASYQLRQRTG